MKILPPKPTYIFRRVAAYQLLNLSPEEEEIFSWIDQHSNYGESRSLISGYATIGDQITTDLFLQTLPAKTQELVRPIHENPTVFREYYDRYEREIKPCIDGLTTAQIFVQYLYNMFPSLKN